MTFLTERFVEPRLGTWDPASGPPTRRSTTCPRATSSRTRRAGCGFAGIYTLVAVASSRLLTVLPGAPLRNPETGAIFGDSPFMNSLIFIITMLFLVAGIGYGMGAGPSPAAPT